MTDNDIGDTEQSRAWPSQGGLHFTPVLLHDIGSYALEQTEFRQLNLESRNGLKY